MVFTLSVVSIQPVKKTCGKLFRLLKLLVDTFRMGGFTLYQPKWRPSPGHLAYDQFRMSVFPNIALADTIIARDNFL